MKKEKIKEISETVKTNEELIIEIKQPEKIASGIMDDFSKFEKDSAEFTPENEESAAIENEEVKEDKKEERRAFTENDKTKLRMFLGFACFFLSGINAFILNKIKGTEVPSKELDLDDDERETLLPYLEDPKVMAFLDKINGFYLGVIQLEYMMIKKHSAVAKDYIKEKTKK